MASGAITGRADAASVVIVTAGDDLQPHIRSLQLQAGRAGIQRRRRRTVASLYEPINGEVKHFFGRCAVWETSLK